MAQEVIIEAAEVDEAIQKALQELGATVDEVNIEVVSEPEKKLFGKTNAIVKVSRIVTDEDAEAEAEDDADEDESGDVQDADADVEDDQEDAINEATPLDTAEQDEEESFNEKERVLTEDELDEIADTAISVIRQLLDSFGASEAAIDEYEGDEGELIFDIVGENLAILIGRHGKTLDSFQFIVSLIVGKKLGYRHPIIVDIEGYKQRRKEKLESLARASAARAIRQKREVRLRAMTPYERRIIHITLKNDKRVTTASDGVEPNRQVVIKLK